MLLHVTAIRSIYFSEFIVSLVQAGMILILLQSVFIVEEY